MNMAYNIITNQFSEIVIRETKGTFLDGNNILWKIIDGKWIGKRSVWTYDFRVCWIEDTNTENIKSWWCGKDNDYLEKFIN
jgi:hypothetical protein